MRGPATSFRWIHNVDGSIRLIFRSAHGDRELLGSRSDSIMDVCRRYGLPAGQVTTYFSDDRGELGLFVKPRQPLGEYATSGSRIVVIPNRNIDYHGLLGGADIVRERSGASTWILTRQHDSRGGDGTFVTETLTPGQARALVEAQVGEALDRAAVKDEPCVIGVSGGGDSNALLGAIVESRRIRPDHLHAVMMLGIPDWDKGVDRATEICARHGVRLRFVEESETARTLGFADPEGDWVTAFEHTFPGDDLEVLGVFGVRKVLRSVAQSVGARTVMVGTNLEDCLADALYSLCNGEVPFPQPKGAMGDIDIVCPLWLTPKSLVDGCFPEFSRRNYEARYPSRMRGRAYFYYLAQMLAEAYPGAGQHLLKGTGALSESLFDGLNYDEEFDTFTRTPMPFDVRLKLRALFGARV